MLAENAVQRVNKLIARHLVGKRRAADCHRRSGYYCDR
jgi:hypothetical protein